MTRRRNTTPPIGRPPSTQPRRTKQIKVQATEDLAVAVAAVAASESRSVSDFGMRMLELGVALGGSLTDAEIRAWRKLAENAKMTPIEWLRHTLHHRTTPVDQSERAQKERMYEALGED